MGIEENEKADKAAKKNNQYVRNDHKTTLYKLLDNQDDQKHL